MTPRQGPRQRRKSLTYAARKPTAADTRPQGRPGTRCRDGRACGERTTSSARSERLQPTRLVPRTAELHQGQQPRGGLRTRYNPPEFEFIVWVSDCEARGVSYRGKESTFRCRSSHEFAESYTAGPGYDCFAWLGSGNPGWQQRCQRGQNDNPGTDPGHFPPDWFIGSYSVPAGRYVPTASFPSRDACLDSLGTTPPPPPPPDPEPEPTPCKLAFASSQKASAKGITLTVKAGPTLACAAKLKAATLHIGKKKYLYVGKLPSRTISAGKSWAVKVGLGKETLAQVKAALGAGKTVKIAAQFTLNGTAAGGISKLTK